MKVVVITGGSSGIGLAIAKRLQNEAVVCLIARNPDKLKNATEGTNFQAYPCDVSNKNDVDRTIGEIAQKNKKIDWVINNAGIDASVRFESISLEEMRYVMDVNYWGAVNITLAAIPYLKKSSEARLGFVSSVSGYIGFYGFSHYSSSKFALTSLAACLRMEFNDYNISVSIIYPADTDTPLHDHELKFGLAECNAISSTIKLVSPDHVACRLIEGIKSKKFEIYCDIQSKIIRIFAGFFPNILNYYLDSLLKKARKNLSKFNK